MSEFDVDDILPDKEPSKKATLGKPADPTRFYRMAAAGEDVGRKNQQILNLRQSMKPSAKGAVQGYSYSMNQPTFSNAVTPSLNHFEDLHELASKVEAHAAAHDAYLGVNDMHPKDREAATTHLNNVWSALADFHSSNSAGIAKHLAGTALTKTGAESIVPRGRRNVADVVGSEQAVGSVGHMRDAVQHLTNAVSHLRNASTISGLGIDKEVSAAPSEASAIHQDYVSVANRATDTPMLEALKGKGAMSMAGTVDSDVEPARPAPLRLPTQPQSRAPRPAVVPGPGVTVTGQSRVVGTRQASPEEVRETLETERQKAGRPEFSPRAGQPAFEAGRQEFETKISEDAARLQAARTKRMDAYAAFVPKPAAPEVSPEKAEQGRVELSSRLERLMKPSEVSPSRLGAFKLQQVTAREASSRIESGFAKLSEARQASISRQDQKAMDTINGHITSGRLRDAAALHLITFGVSESKAPSTYKKHQEMVMKNPVRYLSEQGYDLGDQAPAAKPESRTKATSRSRRSAAFFPQEIAEKETRIPTTQTTSPFTPGAEEAYKEQLAKQDKATRAADASGRSERIRKLGL